MEMDPGYRSEKLLVRKPEPELMERPDQVHAYDQADFREPHEAFVDQFAVRFGCAPSGRMADLGCGPGDLTTRWARRYPALSITAIDGAAEMIQYAQVKYADSTQVSWRCARLPLDNFTRDLIRGCECIVSNSLLHHLPDPSILWEEILHLASPGTFVLTGDLMRPPTTAHAHRLVSCYAKEGAPILQQDFFHSLCAAYTVNEVEQQLGKHDLTWLSVAPVSDRHIVVWGRRP